LKRHSRAIVLVLLVSLFLLYKYGTDSSTIAREKRLKLTLQFEQAGHREDIYAPDDAPDDAHQDAGPQDAAPDPMSVHLVIAGTTSEDISWTSRIKIPGLEVIHYIADDPSAPYHPPANKGREAMIYHNYFYDFYDHLPDVAILTHAQDISWHMEPVLSNSLTFALSHLDLSAVKERGYANLRVSWENACPDYINTTLKGTSGLELEGQSTREAFLGNFGGAAGLPDEVPEILAQPCCSQFAVTRDTIRSVPRERYAVFIDWLLDSSMDDSMLGRTWEHMFQWLFTRKAVDCPAEWKTYCRMYHICFNGKKDYDRYLGLEELRAELIDRFDVGLLKAVWNSAFGTRKQDLVQQIDVVSRQIDEHIQQARERGKIEINRMGGLEYLYMDT
jgi:hypothetical protein